MLLTNQLSYYLRYNIINFPFIEWGIDPQGKQTPTSIWEIIQKMLFTVDILIMKGSYVCKKEIG